LLVRLQARSRVPVGLVEPHLPLVVLTEKRRDPLVVPAPALVVLELELELVELLVKLLRLYKLELDLTSCN
jgi:hypothetical protein